MEAKDVLKELRQRHNMTQDQLSEKLAVTRQAVSRWENGESVPNPETLKQLSALFDTSINHLLGDPRKLICQCCGMPLDSDEVISRDLDGSFNMVHQQRAHKHCICCLIPPLPWRIRYGQYNEAYHWQQ